MKSVLLIVFVILSIVLIGLAIAQPGQSSPTGTVPVETKMSKVTFVLIAAWGLVSWILMHI